MLALFATPARLSGFWNPVAQQIDLFGTAKRVFADGERGGIVYYPAVFSPAESAQLFETLQRSLNWAQETMWMYDKTVTVPRLIARFAPESDRPAVLAGVQQRIESYLNVTFTALSVQYYRDGSDSVAWHNDHREELIDLPTIALLSLGATREIRVRTKHKPRRSIACDLEAGSLFVMTGRAQEFWEHTIPKIERPITARMSIALRQRKT